MIIFYTPFNSQYSLSISFSISSAFLRINIFAINTRARVFKKQNFCLYPPVIYFLFIFSINIAVVYACDTKSGKFCTISTQISPTFVVYLDRISNNRKNKTFCYKLTSAGNNLVLPFYFFV